MPETIQTIVAIALAVFCLFVFIMVILGISD